MRLLLDLASAKDSAAIELAVTLASEPQGHSVSVVLDGTWSDDLYRAHQRLRCVLPVGSIIAWHRPARDQVRLASGMIRAATIAGLAPDILLLAAPTEVAPEWPADLPAPATVSVTALPPSPRAQVIWDALRRYRTPSYTTKPPRRLRLAHLGPLPPDATGVADATSSLLPGLQRYYDLTLFVPDPELVEPGVRAAYKVEPSGEFRGLASGFDRILAQFGNSPFHSEPSHLLRRFPGVAVLHDTMLGDLTAHLAGEDLPTAVFEAEGWPGAVALAKGTLREHACLWPLPQDALGAIVHSRHALAILKAVSNIPAWRAPLPMLYGAADKAPLPAREQARAQLGLAPADLIVACFGAVTPAKCPELVGTAFKQAFGDDHRAQLIFAGEVLAGSSSFAQGRISITGRLTPDAWRLWLAAADIAVQLRQNSHGETSGAVMDTMAAGLPTIVNAHGAMAELPSNAVLSLPDRPKSAEVTDALVRLAKDPGLRSRLGAAAREYVTTAHAPEAAASHYATAIEAAYSTSTPRGASDWLIRRLANSSVPSEDLAPALAASMPLYAQRRLLVDVSIVANKDIGTGIQRVTREVARRLVTCAAPGWRVEAFRGATEGLVLARHWVAKQIGVASPAADELAEIGAGDRVLLLDFPGMVERRNRLCLRQAQAQGAELVLIVYDLLPLLHPEWFPASEVDHSAAYLLDMLGCADAALCISRAVADELMAGLDSGLIPRARSLNIGWFHLGSDFRHDTAGVAPQASVAGALAVMARMPSLLMVGTVEPRKGHAQTLAAFELLWREGREIALVIAGNRGWMTDEICLQLTTHPEMGHKLHWLCHPSDIDLALLYASATGLLATSLGEGFGLPLVEAASAGVPILARDIPVFREITGGEATWFSGLEVAPLAAVIRRFLTNPPPAGNITTLTWDDSAAALRSYALGNEWPMCWRPSASANK